MFAPQSGGLDAILHRQRPSWLQRLRSSPLRTLAKQLYSLRSVHAQDPASPPLTVVCISDTHNSQPLLPPGDLLIHAGDTTQSGTRAELQTQLDWLNKQPHEHKVLIAGNHELFLDPRKRPDTQDSQETLNWGSVIYLQDSAAILKFRGGRSLKIYGSPWTRGGGNWAFQFPPGSQHFTNSVPDDTDVLVTHSPPRFHCDINGFGDESLLHELTRIAPKLHVFGHIHEGHGADVLIRDRFEDLYRNIYRGDGGASLLLLMLCLLLKDIIWPPRKVPTKTVLLNASIVGGLRDEERRKPFITLL